MYKEKIKQVLVCLSIAGLMTSFCLIPVGCKSTSEEKPEPAAEEVAPADTMAAPDTTAMAE
jgi:hypothetical protein